MAKLTKEDYDRLNYMIELSQEILSILYKIMELEQKECIESEEYNRLLSTLNQKKFLYDSIFEKIDKEKYGDAIEYLLGERNNDIKSKLQVAMTKDYSLLARFRIVNGLSYTPNVSKNSNNLDDQFSIGENQLINDLVNYISNSAKAIDASITEDFINTILCILNECIGNPKCQSYISDLLRLKYNLAFLYEFVFEDLTKHNFSINSELYWKSTGIANQVRVLGIEKLRAYYIDGVDLMCLTEILNDNKGSIDSLDIMCYVILRAANLFEYEDVIRKMQDTNSNDYTGCTKYQIDRLKMLYNAYQMYDKDREMHRIISLNI